MDNERSVASIPPDPLEERLRRRLRVIAGFTFLGLVVVLTLADTFAPDRHVSEFIFGSILGALLVLAGVEGAKTLFGRK